MDGNVTLVVKAANQSVPDQHIECSSEWTVLALKNHLSTTHPSKPRVEETRLIYSGQLLLDDLQLRNVLRHPTENNAYVIHLVCSPPRNTASSGVSSSPSPAFAARRQQTPSPVNAQPDVNRPVPQSTTPVDAPSDSNDGLRRRTVNGSSSDSSPSSGTSTTTHQGIDTTTASPSWGYPTPSQLSMMNVMQTPTADPIQQMMTMQQMYANYMAYMQYIQMGAGGGLPGVGGVQWPSFVPPASTATPASSVSATVAPPAAPVVADEQLPPQQPQQQPDINVAPNAQQQPAPQIRMNAQGGEVDDDDENEGMGRDWLDWIYVLSRMVVLLFVVHFYSNVYRFMTVVCIALLLYLYQAGWFRPTRRVENQPQPQQEQPRAPPPAAEGGNENDAQQDDRNNNVSNNNNNNNVPNHLLEGNNNADNEELIGGAGAEGQANPVRGEAEAQQAEAVRPSLLALSWTFLTTFFTSLIPEQPQVI